VQAPLPSLSRTVGWSGGLLLFVALLAGSLSEPHLLLVGKAAAFGIVMLSMVLLTGYGGHVSLAQLAFAGVGALTYAKLDEPNLYGLLVSVLVSAAAGAVVALPVLRLTGLFLALATLAFASIMDKVVFQADWAFGFNGLLPARRLSLLGHSVSSTGGYVFLMAVFLVLTGWLVLLLRRGVFGRLLIAARDSSAACGTLGLDVRWFRVVLFALSSGLAGLGGALYAGLRQNIGAGDFIYFNSLLLLLFAVVAGVTSVTGAVLGGVALTALPELQTNYPSVGGMFFVAIAVFAILLAKEPSGISGYLFRLGRWAQDRIAPSIRANLPTLPGSGDRDHAELVNEEPGGVPAHAH
jgi:branched-chain amino acid transport system permease protein